MSKSEDQTEGIFMMGQQTFDKLQTEFSKFGISPNQSKIFIYLGKSGSKTAPEISRALRLPRTETYSLLTTLQRRGIISATFQHPIQFSALSLDRAIRAIIDTEKSRVRNLEENKDEMAKIWNTIPTFYKEQDVQRKDKFQILQGENQIFGKIHDMINTVEKEFQIMGNEEEFLKFYHANILEPIDKSGIKFKIITNSSERTLYVFDEIDRTKVKKIPKTMNNKCCFLIKDSNEVIIFMQQSKSGKTTTAFWTDSEEMIYSKKLLFNLLWSRSKSIPL